VDPWVSVGSRKSNVGTLVVGPNA